MQVFGPKCNGCSDALKVNPFAIVADRQTELILIESNFNSNLAGSRDLSTSMRRTNPFHETPGCGSGTTCILPSSRIYARIPAPRMTAASVNAAGKSC